MSIFAQIMSQTEKPAPLLASELDSQFWAHCGNRRLCFQRCNACDRWRHLPRHLCAHCGSSAWRWEQSAGRGSIYSWTVVHLPIHPAFAADVPYAVGIIELDEGVRMVSAIRGLDLRAIELGYPVEVCFDAPPGAPLLPWFRPRATP